MTGAQLVSHDIPRPSHSTPAGRAEARRIYETTRAATRSQA